MKRAQIPLEKETASRVLWKTRMNIKISPALNRAVDEFLQTELLPTEDLGVSEALSMSLNVYLTQVAYKLKILSESSGRNTIISLDFYPFTENISLLPSPSTFQVSEIALFTPNEYKRCAPPPEHAYRFSKTKGLRFDDLFSVRKRKTFQTQQIESSLVRLIHRNEFNYDA